eukprot:COSAG02_NODE_3071_length_7425_cov_28.395987_1_plen_228_part_10
MAPIPVELQAAEDTDSMYVNFPVDHAGGYMDANGQWIADGGGYEDDYGEYIRNPDTAEGHFEGRGGQEAVWIATPTKAAPEHYHKSPQHSSPPPNDFGLHPWPGSDEVVVAANDFPAEQAGDLELRSGDRIIVTSRLDSDWWDGHLESDPSKSGQFPSSYVKPAPVSTVSKSGLTLHDLPPGPPPPGPPPPPMAKPSGTRGDLMAEISGGASLCHVDTTVHADGSSRD